MVKKKGGVNRINKIADQIQRDIADLLLKEVKNPRIGFVTIQSVEITPDYAHAKVYFTTLNDDPAITQTALNDASGYIHSLLFKRLHIHTVPTLHFIYDKTLERAAEISLLIEKAMATTAKE